MPRPRTYVCPSCKLAPKEMANGYCRACHRIRDRAFKRGIYGCRPEQKSAVIASYVVYKGLKPRQESCNCGIRSCNGLQCDRRSA